MFFEKTKAYADIAKEQNVVETFEFFFKELKSLPMPRSSLAVLGALILEFPEYFKERQLLTDIKKLGYLMPILIACNDYCDIAIASLEIQSVSHLQSTELVTLERKLWQGFFKHIENFFRDYPDEKDRLEEVFRVYFSESIILSKNRQEHSVIEVLSLDSLLFEILCIEVIVPELNQDLGLSYGHDVNDYETLKSKYERFLVEDGEIRNLNEIERKMVVLHVTEMLLKLSDDEIGIDIDRVLNAPNFKLAKEHNSSHPSLEEVRSIYLKLLRKLDGNIFVAHLGDIIFTLTQKLKLFFKYGRKNAPVFELYELEKLLSGDRNELREKLMKSSILPDLFRENK